MLLWSACSEGVTGQSVKAAAGPTFSQLYQTTQLRAGSKTCLIHENHTSLSTQLSSAHLPGAESSCELSGSVAQSCDGFEVSITASHI